MRRLLLYSVLLFLATGALVAQDKDELQKRKEKTYGEIQLARDLLSKTATSKKTSLNQVRILERSIESRRSYISQLEEEALLLNREIGRVQADMDQLNKDLEQNRQEYARLIYFAYRNHTSYEKLMYILAGESINQSYQRYRYLKYISTYRKQTSVKIGEGIDSLEVKQDLLHQSRMEKLSLLEEKESEQRELRQERQISQRKVNELNQQERKLRRDLADKQRIAKELEKQIKKVIEEEARKASASNRLAALTPEQQLVGKDFRKNKGKLPWPVEQGLITSGYGPQDIPGLRGSTVHNNGVDISSPGASKVRAVFEGEVTKVFSILGANYTVLIRHGEFLTVYQNLVNIRVKTGVKVITKQEIGEAYTDGDENISNIHFEVYHEKDLLNPEEWISK